MVVPAIDIHAGFEFFGDGWTPRGCHQCRHPILMRHHVIEDGAGRDLARPADHRRHTKAPLPVGIFFASKGRNGGIWPGIEVRPIVSAVKDDCIVGDTQLIELIEQPTHQIIVAHHGIVIKTLAGQPLLFFGGMGPKVHSGGVKPNEEGLVLFRGALDELLGGIQKLQIDCFHPIFV